MIVEDKTRKIYEHYKDSGINTTFEMNPGNLFQQLYSLVDSIIVGKGISDQALAAVGATGTL